MFFCTQPWLKKKCSMPIPIELIAVVSGTLISNYCQLPDVYGIRIVGHIPTGWVRDRKKIDVLKCNERFKAELIIRQTAKARVTHFAAVAVDRTRQRIHHHGILHDNPFNGPHICSKAALRDRLQSGTIRYGKHIIIIIFVIVLIIIIIFYNIWIFSCKAVW